MDDVKTWTQSRTVWGALAAILGAILGKLHLDNSAHTVGVILDWGSTLLTVIGSGVAIWGRLHATKKILPADQIESLAWLVIAPALLLGLAGCAGPDPAYMKADRSTFEAVAPEYSAYVAQDPLLAAEQKERRQNTLDVWRMRIEHAEKAAAPATQPAANRTPAE